MFALAVPFFVWTSKNGCWHFDALHHRIHKDNYWHQSRRLPSCYPGLRDRNEVFWCSWYTALTPSLFPSSLCDLPCLEPTSLPAEVSDPLWKKYLKCTKWQLWINAAMVWIYCFTYNIIEITHFNRCYLEQIRGLKVLTTVSPRWKWVSCILLI